MEVLWPLGGEGCYHRHHGIVIIRLLVSQQSLIELAVAAFIQSPLHITEIGSPEGLVMLSPGAWSLFSLFPWSCTGILPWETKNA